MGEKETAAGFAESDESNNTDEDPDAQRSNYLKMHLDRAAGGGGKDEPDVTPDEAAPIIKSKSNITNN